MRCSHKGSTAEKENFHNIDLAKYYAMSNCVSIRHHILAADYSVATFIRGSSATFAALALSGGKSLSNTETTEAVSTAANMMAVPQPKMFLTQVKSLRPSGARKPYFGTMMFFQSSVVMTASLTWPQKFWTL